MNTIDLFKTIILAILLFWSCFNTSAQTFSPEIENYSIEDYNADNQNWSIDIDDKGVAYIANNKGLLRYNGQSWQLFELPQKTIIRSVLCADNKIFVGSYEEFGFWEADDFGAYLYTSLTPLFDSKHAFTNEEFWQIVKFEDTIVFRSFGAIYIYDGKKITYINNSDDTSDLVVYQDKIIVGSLKDRLQELKNGALIPLKFEGNQPHFTAINNLVVFNDLLFLFDLDQNGYIYDSKNFSPLPQKITSFLNNYNINKVVFKDRNTLIFGTIKNGIIIYSFKTESIQHIDKELGLQNNTVLGLKFHNGNLWGTLDNGICKVNFESPYQYYYDLSGSLGTVYDAVYFNNQYYLASNTGVYTFTNDNKLQLIKNSEGHVWSLSILNGTLFCGHNRGAFYIENNELIPTDLSSGGTFNYTKIPSKNNAYLQENYLGISLLQFNEKNWEINPIKNITFPVNKIAFESDSIIWASHPYKGIYRIELNKEFTKALNIKYYGNNKNLKQYKTNVFKINDKVVFYNSGKWFQYFKDADSIGAFNKFKNKVLIGKEKDELWFLDKNNAITFLDLKNDYKEVFKTNILGIKKHLVAKYENIIIKNDSVRIINLNDGFATFNINKVKKRKNNVNSSIIIDKIYSENKLFSTKDTVFSIPFKNAKNISIEAYSPNLYQNDITYTLSGEVEQKETLKNGMFSLQNLPFGKYSLVLQSTGFDVENIANKKIVFKILPPWYLSNIMRVVYLFCIISIILLINRYNKTKIRKEQLVIKKTFIRDTQKRINKLTRENLEKEVLNKKKELSTTTETIIKKNQTIILLRKELNRLVDVSPNKTRTKSLIGLAMNKKDADYDWKIFESSFNELHEDFFKRLISKYPKLTTKDLKLCAYVKSGLTSKEIAPLMGISTRGVEINRYRLRKKINIDSNENISNFLKLF